MVLIGGSFASSVIAGDTLVRFKGAIGDIPVANVAGMANPDGSFPDVIRNIVRGVEPAGQIWVISDFKADVKVNGRIRVDGRGLLLGGGNTIGTNGNASVFATLICEATPPFIEHSTTLTGVPLAANGDFRIDDVLVAAATGRVRQPRTPYPCGAQRSLVCCGHPGGRLAPIKDGHIKVCGSAAGHSITECAAHLCLLWNAKIYLPSRPLDMKKGGAAVDVNTRCTAETTRLAHETLKFWYRSSNGLSFDARST